MAHDDIKTVYPHHHTAVLDGNVFLRRFPRFLIRGMRWTVLLRAVIPL
jgi:hypothetical protein